MVLNDTLANVLSILIQYEKLGKKEVLLKPYSRIIKTVLDILHKEGYVGSYEVVKDVTGGHLKLNLIGRINNCGVVKPRFAIKIDDFEKREKQYLPAKGFGVLILSTPKGIMTQHQAQENHVGGRLLAYCY